MKSYEKKALNCWIPSILIITVLLIIYTFIGINYDIGWIRVTGSIAFIIWYITLVGGILFAFFYLLKGDTEDD